MVLTDIQNNIKDVEQDASKLHKYLNELLDWLTDKVFALLIALVVIVIGFKVARWLTKHIRNSFERAGMENSVIGFLTSLIKGVMYSVVIIAAASIMGFQVTSLVTILGTASLAIGLALQGSLANFAGGVLILIMKPFKVGDYIIENDKKCEGTVEAIDIFYTKLKTYDNKRIVIPNGNITSNSIVNLTAEKIRRLDLRVGVSYDSDIKVVKQVLESLILNSDYYLTEYEYNVFVDELAESSIKMGLRCYVKTEEYWNAKWSFTELIKLSFDKNGIEIPYNKLDVNICNEQEKSADEKA